MANLTMDLTASLSNYAVTNQVFKIFKYEQQIDFGTPVFADSIVVYLASGGISGVSLTLNTDYIIPDDAVTACDNDASAARLMDPNFDKTLCKGITVIKPVIEGEFSIAISYQRLYPRQIPSAYYKGAPINFTPELLTEMVETLQTHDQQLSRVVNISTETSSKDVKLLEVDANASDVNNDITDEIHTVNTSTGRILIHPQAGSYYADSLVVKVASTGEILTRGVDYECVGLDSAAVKASAATSAIYHFILITSSTFENVSISYHAFGGQPTLENYRSLLENVTNVISYLNSSNSLTLDTLPTSPVVTSMLNRINTLEANMRRLQGTSTYGDITSGKVIAQKLFAETAGLNWFTIASLYTTHGQTSPCTADTFIFRLQSLQSRFNFMCAVAVDLHNSEGYRLQVDTLSDNSNRGFIPFEDYENVADIIYPQLRIIWNSQDVASGCLLQIGFNLKTMNKETIVIEDMSGYESCWKLVDETDNLTLPSNSEVALPDGVSTWSTSLEESICESTLIPFKNGHLVYAQDIKLNESDGWSYTTITDLLINDEGSLDISRIRKVRCDIAETDGYEFAIDIPFNASSKKMKGHATFTHGNKPAYINAELYENEDGSPEITLGYNVTAGAQSNQLTIKDLVVYL